MACRMPRLLWHLVLITAVLFVTLSQASDQVETGLSRDQKADRGTATQGTINVPTMSRRAIGLSIAKAAEKGAVRLAMLWGVLVVPPTEFPLPASLEENGYKLIVDGRNSEPECEPLHQGFLEIFHSLALSASDEDNPCFRVYQYRGGITDDGFAFDHSGGKFINRINSKNGVIVGMENYGPWWYLEGQWLTHERLETESAAEWDDEEEADSPTASEIQDQVAPPLQRTSDILGCVISAECRQLNTLQWWFMYDIFEKQSNFVINQIVEQLNAGPVGEWPGLVFSMDTVHGRALLGTPIASAIAWLLTQRAHRFHAQYLVYKVHIFSSANLDPDSPDRYISLAFAFRPRKRGEEIPKDLLGFAGRLA